MTRNILLTIILVLGSLGIKAQKFFNLSADEVRIEDRLPRFTYSMPLGTDYSDSTYVVEIEYPEFIDMSANDVSRVKKISSAAFPELPVVNKNIVVERKKGYLEVYFNPIVFRKGKYQKLVSFMLKLTARPKNGKARMAASPSRASKADRYAASSVLSTGKWAKISVPTTGVYQLTDALIRQAGFTDLAKVKVYGYGGALHDEQLSGEKIMQYDDLKQVPQCVVGGKRLFHAVGPVSWDSPSAVTRTRNPYSDYGYYFITQNDEEPLVVDSAAFVSSFYPSNDDYHALHEVDDYAWYQGGRNLFESTPINQGASQTYTLAAPSRDANTRGTLNVVLTTGGSASTAQIEVNDSVVGTVSVSGGGTYDHGRGASRQFVIPSLNVSNSIKITNQGSAVMRLDYISLTFSQPHQEPLLTVETFPTPQYVYNITNQNHHADGQYDMVIIIPTSQNTLSQAEILKSYHEQHDGMRVKIVAADELYNEFSSGTPEADAYRLYMKMLYDRAETEADMPKYLLLFGDCVWDNRMNTTATRNLIKDNYLLCFESENSFSATRCFVDDGYFCSLDDGEGRNASADNDNKADRQDIAVGRFPVSTEADAKVMVDKSVSYMENKNAGAWQNLAMFLGDDGNYNAHMKAADNAASLVEELNPGMQVKRVLWDMYDIESWSTGYRYPVITSLLKKQMQEGALLFDYCGHGRADELSHEMVLSSADFAQFKNTALPLWITASCDIMPFDGTLTTIGENAVLNPNGGAVAFYGTTRTVYTDRNERINRAYLRALFSKTSGKYNSIGEAQRLAKNSLITDGTELSVNKLQYSLLGDPALALNIPEGRLVIDSINNVCLKEADTLPQIKAGSKTNVKGHVELSSGELSKDFNGILYVDVKDSKEQRTGKKNRTDEESGTAGNPYTYYEHIKTIFAGTDSIKSGKFDVTFAVTKDINYADQSGLLVAYGLDSRNGISANGRTEDFSVGGTDDLSTDSIGPSIYCYLNSPNFTNGDRVNSTPYFVAQISDDDGLNTSGSGIGHDLTLCIDGDNMKTYSLNDNFSYDFGSYTNGTTFYNIPELEEGQHTLKFTAWDILNNPSTATLKFSVVHGLTPRLSSVGCSSNPAKNSTTFIVNHDRSGSELDVVIEVFDMSGRILWTHEETGVSTTSTYTYSWDLCTDGGGKLQTGVYLYRVRLSSDGSGEVSKAKKLIVLD